MRNIYFTSVITFIVSCSSNSHKEVHYDANNNQVMYAKDSSENYVNTEIEIISNEPFIGEELRVKIYSKDKRFSVKSAYYKCENLDSIKIDSSTGKVLEWRKKMLYMEEDTVKIFYTSSTEGTNTFGNVTLLLQGTNSVYYLLDTSFVVTIKDTFK